MLKLNDIGATEIPIKTLIVRISPFLSQEDALSLATVLERAGVNAVSAFNTFSGGKPVNASGNPRLKVPDGLGGQSGSAMASQAETQTKWLVEARDKAGAHFDIIGSNGVTDAESMKRRLDLGASAVSATTLFWEGQKWGTAVDRILSEFALL